MDDDSLDGVALSAVRAGEPGRDGLTNAERQLLIDEFLAAEGARPTKAQLAELRAFARQLPARKLRPAG
jgi:hypothetical protein